jgi:hypothetical protein
MHTPIPYIIIIAEHRTTGKTGDSAMNFNFLAQHDSLAIISAFVSDQSNGPIAAQEVVAAVLRTRISAA